MTDKVDTNTAELRLTKKPYLEKTLAFTEEHVLSPPLMLVVIPMMIASTTMDNYSCKRHEFHTFIQSWTINKRRRSKLMRGALPCGGYRPYAEGG